MSTPNLPTFEALEQAIRASWGPDTCDPCDLENWETGPPSKGMCIVTSLVLQDYLGGELLEAKVFVGEDQPGYHTWLLLDGVEIDLTRDQFTPEEVVGEAYLVPRITGPDMRLADQYETLRSRVAAILEPGSADSRRPAMTGWTLHCREDGFAAARPRQEHP